MYRLILMACVVSIDFFLNSCHLFSFFHGIIHCGAHHTDLTVKVKNSKLPPSVSFRLTDRSNYESVVAL